MCRRRRAGRRRLRRVGGALPGGWGVAQAERASPDLRSPYEWRGRCRTCEALPGGWGVAGPARRCRAAWASPLNLQPQKKHDIWKKPPCTWYSGFFHCEKLRDSGRRKHRVEDFRRRVSVVRRSAASDLVPHSPQTLILSSTSTTSLGSKAPAACRTWCLTPRKPLFFRPQAPRLSGPKRRRRTGRGASLSAIPCSFVRKHHVSRVQWDFDVMDVVPHSPQALIPSSGSTTSPGPDGPTPALTWCSIPRKPLFFRPEAPRPQVRMGRRRH